MKLTRSSHERPTYDGTAWFDYCEDPRSYDAKSTSARRRSILWGKESKPTVASQFRATLFNSWLNILFILVPAGISVRYTKGNSLATFLVNFFAIIPLSIQAEYAIAELICYIGGHWGGLAYITISNFVQIVSCIVLLRSNQMAVLQTNLIGGILSSILLILGLSIFLGGLNRIDQQFNLTVAHLSANLLSLAATSLLIPTASHLLLQTSDEHILRQSRGAAFILLTVYVAFLLFEFYSHVDTWKLPNPKTPKRTPDIDAIKNIAVIGGGIAASVGGSVVQETPLRVPPEDKPVPALSFHVLLLYLIIVETLAALCTQYAVDSIDAFSSKANLSKTFIGLVLLPILNNDLMPVGHALKDEMHMTMNFTIGKCLQTSLFVTPLMVIIAWGMGRDLTLSFDGFEVVSLFASILLLNYLIIDARSSWIQGVLLIADWILIALAAFYASGVSH